MIRTQENYTFDTRERLEAAITSAQEWLLDQQAPDGHWCAELEGDTILESEYVMYLHFIDQINEIKITKLANYIRSRVLPVGGWAIYPGGPMDISASVKAYLVLKIAGDSTAALHMSRARAAILAAGGI